MGKMNRKNNSGTSVVENGSGLRYTLYLKRDLPFSEVAVTMKTETGLMNQCLFINL